MSNLGGQVGELRFTVQITRKDTGKVEDVELIGYLDADKLKELQDGCNPQHGGKERGD